MRIDLNTTYAEHRKAKALGARWDAFKRVWYIIDPSDLTPFLKWIPSVVNSLPMLEPEQPKDKQLRPRFTGPAHIAHCGCDALPWDDCIHTILTTGSKPKTLTQGEQTW